MKTSTNNSPVFINMTKAANLLGYKSAVVIRNLIKEGLLTKYSFPDSSMAMVAKTKCFPYPTGKTFSKNNYELENTF